MKKKSFLSYLLICLLLLTLIPQNVFANNNETTEDEIPWSQGIDNWQIQTVFYDSGVNNGKTPLTAVNWDASDGSYLTGTPRVITTQINYKNTNCIKDYETGTVSLSIPNILYDDVNDIIEKSCFEKDIQVTVSANTPSSSGFDWNFSKTSGNAVPSIELKNFVFTNNIKFDESANFEGSIQVVYTLTPVTEYYSLTSLYPEKYEDSCVQSFSNNNVFSTLKTGDITETSNVGSFNYTRTYTHPWQHSVYTVDKEPFKITSYDKLGKNPENYTWVRYDLSFLPDHDTHQDANVYPYVDLKTGYFSDILPEGCRVIDSLDMQEVSPVNESNEYRFEFTKENDEIFESYGYVEERNIFVGYPKSIYNEESGNLNITNTVNLYGIYDDSTTDEYEFLSTKTVSLNLINYVFSYSGELYGISKWVSNSENDFFWNFISSGNFMDNKKYSSVNYYMSNVKALYTGEPMTIRIYDDLAYATSIDGEAVRLTDDEYKIYRIQIPTSFYVRNGSGNPISYTEYPMKVFVRYAGDSDYTLYTTIADDDTTVINFADDEHVVAFYLEIEDLNESFIYGQDKYTSVNVQYNLNPLKHKNGTGTVYNFNALEVYFKDEEGNLVLQNTVGEDSYANQITFDDIAPYDLATYGHYMQRGVYYRWYSNFDETFSIYTRVSKQSSKTLTNNEGKYFYGTFEVSEANNGYYINSVSQEDTEYQRIYRSSLSAANQNKKVKRWSFYDLLPEGMECTSSEEDILNSVLDYNFSSSNRLNRSSFYNNDFTYRFASVEEAKAFIKDHMTVSISPNWNNMNRTKIEVIVDISDEPLFISNDTGGKRVNFAFDWRVSYDNLLEYGNVYTNEVFEKLTFVDDKEAPIYAADKADIYDLDENGSLTNKMSYATKTITITNAIASYQDVQVQVQTDKSNYSTGLVYSSANTPYSYKLRVRTGASNDVTNFVIYNNIEEAFGPYKHWKGTFTDIDCSYAESQGYTIRTYWSSNIDAGSLTSDSSWSLYDDTVDKLQVKSLAFQYLDAEGNAAIIPADSKTYVEVKMLSPNDSSLKTKAYNAIRTEWNAIDPDTGVVIDGVTGINSNTVRVGLNSEAIKVTVIKEDDEGSPVVGAVLQIINADGVVVDEWTTDENPHIFEASESGYKLHELSVPDGYEKAEDIDIVCDETDVVYRMIDKRVLFNNLTIRKELTSYKEAVNTENRAYSFVQDSSNPHKWVSDNKGINSSLARSVWEIEVPEDNTPYSIIYKVSSERSFDKLTIELDDSIIVNNISGDGTELSYDTVLNVGIHTITASYSKDSSSHGFNDEAYIILNPIEVEAGDSNKEFNFKIELSELGPYNSFSTSDGNSIVADENGRSLSNFKLKNKENFVLYNLPVGSKYKVTELANEEYQASFVIENFIDAVKDKDEGLVNSILSTEKETIDFKENATIKFTNKYIPKNRSLVKISKVNRDNEFVENAKLQLLTEDRVIVEEWISSNAAHEIELEEGNYIIKEIEAPNGYLIAEEQTFTVDGSLDEIEISMIDEYLSVLRNTGGQGKLHIIILGTLFAIFTISILILATKDGKEERKIK